MQVLPTNRSSLPVSTATHTRLSPPGVTALPRFRGSEAEAPPRSRLLSALHDTVFAAKCWIENTLLQTTKRHLPLEETTFTVFDLETTGLNAKQDAITEIAAIKYKNGKEIGKFTTLVKPTVPIPPEIEELTNISNEMVKNAPDPKTALKNLSRFVGPNPILVGHFVNFDVNFVRTKLDAFNLGHLKDRFVLDQSFCTKTLARKVIPDLPSYSGTKLAAHLGIGNPQAHRAEHDTRMTGQIFFELIKRLKSQGTSIRSVDELQTYQGRPQRIHGG